MLTYEALKNKPRELLAATGLTQPEFETLLVAFEQGYENAYPAHQTVAGQPRQRRKGGGHKGKLKRMEDKLLFILIHEKTYPLQTMLGLQFGLSQGRVNEWIHRLTGVLQDALAHLQLTPERDGEAVQTSAQALEGGADLVLDGTERRRQRPSAAATQRDHYSGKKSLYPQKSGSH